MASDLHVFVVSSVPAAFNDTMVNGTTIATSTDVDLLQELISVRTREVCISVPSVLFIMKQIYLSNLGKLCYATTSSKVE